MKKFLSLILSLVMVLGVSTVTFADVVSESGDVSSVDLAKIYKLANDNVANPAETFNFTVTNESVSDSQYTLDGANGSEVMPSISPASYAISFTEGEATLAGDKNTTAITLPTYNHVGIFTYKITETKGSTAGVDYDAKPIYLKVTVTEENGQKIRHVAFHYGTVDGSKTEAITNTYKAGNLAITKKVTGNMGETDRYFDVKVTLTATEGVAASTVKVTGGSKQYDQTVTFIDNKAEITVQLKNDDTVTLSNLPYGVTYTVVEDDYTGDDYDAATYNWSDNNKKVDSAQDTVTITNNKQKGVDTGILVDNLPYIIILTGVVVGMGVFFIKKRTANNN